MSGRKTLTPAVLCLAFAPAAPADAGIDALRRTPQARTSGRASAAAGRPRAAGFTYIGLLIAVAIMGVALAGAGTAWQTVAQREREAQLLFAGEQFRRAIGSYYEASPGPQKQYPASLRDLLADERHPRVKRHLRRVYADPMTRSADWGIVRGPGERITGVYSRSASAPFKRAGFGPGKAEFASASSYADWKFVYSPSDARAAGAAPGTPGAAGFPSLLPGAGPAAAAPGAAPKAEPDRRLCDQIRRNDDGVCATLRVQNREQQAIECAERAEARYQACRAGEALPNLTAGR